MCHDRFLRRRREAGESRAMWEDFERTRPVADQEPAPDVTPPEPTEATGEAATQET